MCQGIVSHAVASCRAAEAFGHYSVMAALLGPWIITHRSTFRRATETCGHYFAVAALLSPWIIAD